MSENIGVVIYDDIEKAPADRFFKFNSYMALAAETGDGWEDLTTRVKRANGYVVSDDKQSAFKELSNMLLAFSFIKNEFSPTAMAYAVQVKSINGEECNDLSEKGLIKTIEKLSKIGVSFGSMKTETERIKKKSFKSLLSSLKKRFLDET